MVGNNVHVGEVYIVEYRGQKRVLKKLQEDFKLRGRGSRVENASGWEAVALDAVSVCHALFAYLSLTFRFWKKTTNTLRPERGMVRL